MRWRPYRLQEVLVKNFRCFHDQRTVCLTPLTLLVGDNSTGKTSFLAALRLVWDIAYRKVEPNFRQSHYDLGLFPEIAFNSGSRRYPTDSFEIGFRTVTDAGTSVSFTAAFREKDGAPYPATLSWSNAQVWVKRWISDDGHTYTDFGTRAEHGGLSIPIGGLNPAQPIFYCLSSCGPDLRHVDAILPLGELSHSMARLNFRQSKISMLSCL